MKSCKDTGKGKKQYILCDAEKIEKIKRSPGFHVPELTAQKDWRRFFIFRWPGDEIEGYLGEPITNYRRNTSYPIRFENGGFVEIFGNKILHDTINHNQLVGALVKIVYIGLRPVPGMTRQQKVYEVYKIQGWDWEKQPRSGK